MGKRNVSNLVAEQLEKDAALPDGHLDKFSAGDRAKLLKSLLQLSKMEEKKKQNFKKRKIVNGFSEKGLKMGRPPAKERPLEDPNKEDFFSKLGQENGEEVDTGSHQAPRSVDGESEAQRFVEEAGSGEG